MSSTNSSQEEYAAFFETLSAAGASGGAEYFPLCADSTVQSYYIKRDLGAAPYLNSFEGPELAAHLRVLWASRPELIALIPGLVALYASAAARDDGDEGDISPFIYEMF